MIVAKGPGVMNKASSYAERLRLGIAVIHGERKDTDESGLEDGRQSPPPDADGVDYAPFEIFPCRLLVMPQLQHKTL